MLIVEPVLTEIALEHELVDVVRIVHSLTMTINVKKCLIVPIMLIVAVFFKWFFTLINFLVTFLHLLLLQTRPFFFNLTFLYLVHLLIILSLRTVNLASKGHSVVSTVAPEGKFRVKFHHFVIFVAMEHACETKSVRFNPFGQLLQKFFFVGYWGNLLIDISLFCHVDVARFAGEHVLVNIPIPVPTFLFQILWKKGKKEVRFLLIFGQIRVKREEILTIVEQLFVDFCLFVLGKDNFTQRNCLVILWLDLKILLKFTVWRRFLLTLTHLIFVFSFKS